MDDFQAYIFLLNDSILSSLVFIPSSSYAGEVMLALGSYNPYFILIMSLVGSIIGASINWLIGSLLRKLEGLGSKTEALNQAEVFFNAKGKWILLLSMIPVWGALFTTAAGVLRFSFAHFLILVTFSKFIGLSFAVFL